VNQYVHRRLTRRWALETGFSAEEAEEIAAADMGVDLQHGGDLFHPGNWHYHFRLFGADLFAAHHMRLAVETGSLEDLGIALHMVQDSVAHGWSGLLRHAFDPGTDIWEERSQRVREKIERRTRERLERVYDARRRRAGE
jgi:uncharacterized protein YukE